MNSTADDLVVITAALPVLAGNQNDSLAGLVAVIYPGQVPGWAALVITPVAMMLLSLAGIHPVITSTALLAALAVVALMRPGAARRRI